MVDTSVWYARLHNVEGLFLCLDVPIEELRVRIMKLKQEVDWEPTPYQAEKDMAQKYLSYALDILDEYRF